MGINCQEIEEIAEESRENSIVSDRLRAFEGVSVSEQDIQEARIRNELVRPEEDDLNPPHGFHNPKTGEIVINSEYGSSPKVHEHELVHRLLDIESGKYEEGRFHAESSQGEHFKVIESDRLADKYGIDTETTRALVFQDKKRFRESFIHHRSNYLADNIEPDGKAKSQKYETPLDEVITYYLDGGMKSGEVDSEFFGLNENQYSLVKDYMKRLHKEVRYDARELIKEFSEFETYQDLERRAGELPKVTNHEENKLNC